MASATSLPAIAASALQLTEYSDKICTKPDATEIVASFPFVGCANGVQVKVLPMSPYVINPCFYFRQNGLLSSTTVKPALPLVPGIWNVTSYYTSAAGCTDITKQARPLYCSAVLSTDPSVTCEPQACSVRGPRASVPSRGPPVSFSSPPIRSRLSSPCCPLGARWSKTRKWTPSACKWAAPASGS
jgi:hypothetical protein